MVARNTMRFPLGAGIDRKSDSKHVPAPKCELLQNVELRSNGKIRKRRALKTAADGSAGDVATLVGGNQRLLVNADSTCGEVIRAQGSTYDAPSLISPVTSAGIVVSRKSREYRYGSCAAFDGKLGVVTHEPDPTGAFNGASVAMEVDPDTFALDTPGYPDDRPITSSPDQTNVRVRAVADHGFLVLWWNDDGNKIQAQLYVDGAFQGSATTLASTASDIYDAIVDSTGDVLYLVYDDGSNRAFESFDITGTGSSITITTTGNSNVNGASPTAVTIALDEANSRVIMPAVIGGAAVSVAMDLDYTNGVTTTMTTVSGAGRMTAVHLSGTSRVAVYHNGAGGVVQQDVPTGVSSTPGTAKYMYGVSLAHEVVEHSLHGNNVVFVGLFQSSTFESYSVTVMAVPLDADNYPVPIAQYLYGTAAQPATTGANTISAVAAITTDTGTRFFWAASVATELRSQGTGLDSNHSLGVLSFDLSAATAYNHAHGHSAMMVAGGIPAAIVGNPVMVAGFLASPDVESVTAVNGGNIPDGTYNVAIVWELLDQHGRIWQSRPSTTETVTTSGTDSSIEFVVNTPVVPKQTEELGPTVTMAIYLTDTLGTGVKYRGSEYSGNDVADFHDSATITVTETSSAFTADLTTREVLYTDTGELEHYPPPPCSTIVKHKNRFAAVHSESGDIWFSFEFVEGQGIFWNPQLVVKVDDPSDKPTALVSTDSALMVLSKNRMGYIYGDGPNNQGLGQPFSNVQFLPDADVGAIGQKAVLKLPMGALFCDGDKGFHVVPYGGAQPQYVGRDLDGAPTETIVGMAHLPDRHEARVVYYDAEAISDTVDASWHTWHYDSGDWSHGLATGYTASNRYALADGNEFLIDGAGEKTTNGYDATSTYVVMRIRTGWIVLEEASRVQGQFRLWNIYCLSESVDGHDLNVDIYYDYDLTGTATNLDVAARAPGDDRLRVWPGRQLIEAFKLDIFDASAGGGSSTGEGPELSDIEIHFGVYPAIKPRVAPGDVAAGS
jgi:hypothetical protein|tara:strand:+ start:8247 stop:11270 length:3024 start_codon:yes stop_codon:yes gene_type:complete